MSQLITGDGNPIRLDGLSTAEAKQILVAALLEAWLPQVRALADREVASLLRFADFDPANAAQYAARSWCCGGMPNDDHQP